MQSHILALLICRSGAQQSQLSVHRFSAGKRAYSAMRSAGDNRQHAKFHKYMAAPLEAKWAALVDEVDPQGCKDWMPGGRLVTEATQDIKTGLWNSSFSHFKYLAKDGRTMLYPIEPLFSSLRHPYLLTYRQLHARDCIENILCLKHLGGCSTHPVEDIKSSHVEQKHKSR